MAQLPNLVNTDEKDIRCTFSLSTVIYFFPIDIWQIYVENSQDISVYISYSGMAIRWWNVKHDLVRFDGVYTLPVRHIRISLYGNPTKLFKGGYGVWAMKC